MTRYPCRIQVSSADRSHEKLPGDRQSGEAHPLAAPRCGADASRLFMRHFLIGYGPNQRRSSRAHGTHHRLDEGRTGAAAPPHEGSARPQQLRNVTREFGRSRGIACLTFHNCGQTGIGLYPDRLIRRGMQPPQMERNPAIPDRNWRQLRPPPLRPARRRPVQGGAIIVRSLSLPLANTMQATTGNPSREQPQSPGKPR